MFKRNLKTKPSDEEEVPEERLELEATEISREEDRSAIGEITFLHPFLYWLELLNGDFRIEDPGFIYGHMDGFNILTALSIVFM